MNGSAYTLAMPRVSATSAIFASPHSGSVYDPAFLRRSVLDAWSIRSSEDAFVDQLFAAAPTLGAPLLAACAPRSFVDLNRSADELDPALIDGVPRGAHNPRVSSGLGVVPRVVSNGRAIYRGKMPYAEAEARIEAFWRPYHAALRNLIRTHMQAFGEMILVDCHSMPHEAIEGYGASLNMGGTCPQVVLGDRFGASASAAIVDRIEAAFTAAGLRVVRNAPFAGAFIAQQYGRPSQGQHVVQIEIDRSLYMDEALIRPNAGFDDFRQLMTGVIAAIVEIGRGALPLAAE